MDTASDTHCTHTQPEPTTADMPRGKAVEKASKETKTPAMDTTRKREIIQRETIRQKPFKG